MKIRLYILAAAAVLGMAACGPRKKAAEPATRAFPAVEIPMMITEPAERVAYLALHFWDRFSATDRLFHCDSLTINGVSKEDVEKQMGIFATMLEQAPAEVGTSSMQAFYGRLDAFQRAFPGSNMLPEMAAMTQSYFYDPNSPVRSEELYLPFVQALAASELIDPTYRTAYDWDARMCALNRRGTPAADFTFIDTAGRKRTLYGVKARRLLLIFGNPDCGACRDLMETMENIPQLQDLLDDGSLKVVDIYIDEDITLWKSKQDTYPARWINGYDPSFVIRTDLLYNVRALPSIYLLAEDKTVLLKDCTPEAALRALLPGM